jgi:class 3 adenylate cyclase/predicted ATPase
MHRVVPELIVENFREGRFQGNFTAAGMFVDLTGFSSMTDTLMQHGQHGAEVLANLMHSVFNPLVENIFNYGGKIVSFAGDGIMALFPIDDNERVVAVRALASAWTIQGRLSENPVRQTVYGKFTFSVKIGVTIGDVSWRILRSNDLQSATYYFRGAAVDHSAKAEHAARPGEIMLTDRIRAVAANLIQTTPFASFHRLTGFVEPLPDPAPSLFPPADLEISRHFVPEEIITQTIGGEFRQIVNLFIRFPDLPDETLSECIRVIFELREQYGGLITRLDFGDKGCNMLMLWGAPVAFENDIGRALNFALDLKARMNFAVTAGVTYYVAHAGYLGSEMCEDYTCYGWGVNLASRFMMSASDGEIWVDERIARRVKNRFDFEYQGAQYFKGFAAEQKVFSFVSRKPQELFHQGEFVGREVELPRLIEYVAPLWQGDFSGVTVIWGDAGIGKSRLVYELMASHMDGNRKVLWALCHTDQILRHSFNPFRYWLFHYFGIHSAMDDAARKAAFGEKLDGLIRQVAHTDLARELERCRSILGALVDLYWHDSFYTQLDAEERYNLTLASLIALVKAESLIQPVVIFLEDGQFLDEDTKTFLPRLKRALTVGPAEYPVAILISSRPFGAENFLTNELTDHAITLSALSTHDLLTLAEIHLGGVVSPDLVNFLQARSEGNPYFAEQILLYLQEEKLLETSEKGWRVVARMQEGSLPADIRALLVARLDQLTRRVRDTIQTAAVLGREFEVHVLAEMLHDDRVLENDIVAAERANIWTALSQLRYLFTHGLLRDAAYAMQMRSRRQELHALAMVVLERIHASDLEHHYGELAYHAEHAQIPEKALDYLRLAATTAADKYQNSRSLDFVQRALAFVAAENVQLRFDLVQLRLELFQRMGKRDLQLEDLNALEGWATLLDDNIRLADTLMKRAVYFHALGHYLNAVECSKRADACLSATANPSLRVKIQSAWASSLLRLGKPDDAMNQASVGLDAARQHGLRVEQSEILTVMGLIALEQTDPTPALAYLEESLRIAREQNRRRLQAYAVNNLALAEGSLKGNYALAAQYYEESYNISKEIGDRYQEGLALANLGFVSGMMGNLSAAHMYHEHSLLVAREIGNTYQETYTLINLSAVTSLQNDAARALDYARQAESLGRKIHDRSGEAWALLYMGHAQLLLRDHVEARKAFQKSVSIRHELKQPALSMEPQAGLLETAMQITDMTAAAQEADRILEYFESGGSLDGTDEPLRVYHTCYLYLRNQKDPRAAQLLQNARQLLDAQVSKFSDPQVRASFIENFPWRRSILDASIGTDATA